MNWRKWWQGRPMEPFEGDGMDRGIGRYVAGLQAFSSSEYRLFAIMFVLSNAGLWTLRVGISWLIWRITESTLWLGALAFAEFISLVLCSAAAGGLTDRYGARRITLLTELSILLIACALSVLSMFRLITAELLFLLAFGIGIASAVNQPTQLSWFPALLASKAHIGSATTINNLGFNAARFVGPAVAGAMIIQWSVSAVFAAAAVLTLAAVIVISRIAPSKGATQPPAKSDFWQHTKDGYEYVISHPRIRIIFILVGCTAVSARGVPELAPAIADLFFRNSSAGFSALISAAGLGSIASGIWNIGRNKRQLPDTANLVLAFSFLMAFSVALLCLSSNFWSGLFSFFLLGFCITATAINAQTIIQTVVAQEYRGRVNALYYLVFRSGTALGAVLMATASASIGLEVTLLAGALLCFLAWLSLRRTVTGLFASSTTLEATRKINEENS